MPAFSMLLARRVVTVLLNVTPLASLRKEQPTAFGFLAFAVQSCVAAAFFTQASIRGRARRSRRSPSSRVSSTAAFSLHAADAPCPH